MLTLTLRHNLVTIEASPLEESMFIEVDITHEIVHEHDGVITVATTVHFYDVGTEQTVFNPTMNLIH